MPRHHQKALADIRKTLVDIAVKRGWDHATDHELTRIVLFLRRTSGNTDISTSHTVLVELNPFDEGMEILHSINYPASAKQLCRMLDDAEAALPANATTPTEYFSRKTQFEKNIDALNAMGLTEKQADDVARAMNDLSRYNASAPETMRASLRVGEHECAIHEYQTLEEQERIVDWLLC